MGAQQGSWHTHTCILSLPPTRCALFSSSFGIFWRVLLRLLKRRHLRHSHQRCSRQASEQGASSRSESGKIEGSLPSFPSNFHMQVWYYKFWLCISRKLLTKIYENEDKNCGNSKIFAKIFANCTHVNFFCQQHVKRREHFCKNFSFCESFWKNIFFLEHFRENILNSKYFSRKYLYNSKRCLCKRFRENKVE